MTEHQQAAAPDIKAILAAARRRETTVRVCLAGDLAADADRLTAELARLEDTPRSSLGDASPRAELVAELDTVIELMRANEATFRFRALPVKDFSDLVAAHPSTKDDEAWSSETFPMALVAAACVSPVMSVEDVQELWDVLTFGSRTELWNAAYEACRSDAIQVPTSRAASTTPSSSGAR